MRAMAYILLLLLTASVIFGQERISIYEKVHGRADLPTGGEFVSHPRKELVEFYHANRMQMWSDRSNAQKHSGLYISSDGGETWKLLCHFFEFNKLFIHPETEKLYAIIRYEWLDPNEKGYLVPHIADKALESSDGKNWKDIMGKQKYVATIYDIFVDPDNSKRVCLRVNVMRAEILQSSDDNYTGWEWYRAEQWDYRHEIKTRKNQ
jgi:hypothetical protein